MNNVFTLLRKRLLYAIALSWVRWCYVEGGVRNE